MLQWNKPAWLLPVAAPAVLCACTAGPDFVRPDAPAATAYTHDAEATRSATGITLQPGKDLPRQWWSLFGSERLDQTVQLALRGNHDLQSAQQTLEQAQAMASASTGARYPQIGLDVAAGRQKIGAASLGDKFQLAPFTYYSIGPAVSYTLDLNGAVRRGFEAAQAGVDYQGYQLDAAYLSLTGNVALQALHIAAAHAQIDAVRALLADDERNTQLVRKAFDAGSVSRVDVLSAQAQAANDQTLLPPLLQQLSAARHALSVLVGKLPADWVPPDFNLQELTLPAALPLAVPSQLVRRRPDILAAEAQLHEATARLGVASADLYPSITLTAAGSMQATSLGHLFDSSSTAGSLLGSLTLPLYSHGRLRAQQRAAAAATRASLSRYEQTVLTSFGQVADLLDALEHDRELVAAQQQALDLAADNLRLTRESYSAGNVGILQLLDAGRSHEQAQLGWIGARAQRYQDTLQLVLAMGGRFDVGNADAPTTDAPVTDAPAASPPSATSVSASVSASRQATQPPRT